MTTPKISAKAPRFNEKVIPKLNWSSVSGNEVTKQTEDKVI